MDYRKIPSLKILEKLPNPTEGEIVFCEQENAPYIYKNGYWSKHEPVEINSGITLMEMNRNIISQMPPIDMEKEKESIMEELINWTNNYSDHYYMLYGKEIGYFTLIHEDEFSCEETVAGVALECLQNLGPIYSVSMEPGAYEFWVKLNDTGAYTCLYLFPFDNGVTEVR
jgi:hypothetical protein